MRINFPGGHYLGLGDLLCFAWCGEGSGRQLQFITPPAREGQNPWRAETLRLFRQPCFESTDISNTMTPLPGYEKQDFTSPDALSYVRFVAKSIGYTGPIQRPTVDISPMDKHFGKQWARPVLLFPFAAWPLRNWPALYWLELSAALDAAGVEHRFILQEKGATFHNRPTVSGLPISQLIACVQNAQLVIGNDSGPAHLAGTLGVRTLALQGPTTEKIFEHLPSVKSIRKKAQDCAGCHWQAPRFRKACAACGTCHELLRLLPEDVIPHMLEALGLGPKTEPAAPAPAPVAPVVKLIAKLGKRK